MKSKAQSWSMDIIIGAVIFIGAFFVIYGLLNSNQTAKAGSLKEEALGVSKQVASEEAALSVINNNEVNDTKLNELKSLDYAEPAQKDDDSKKQAG